MDILVSEHTMRIKNIDKKYIPKLNGKIKVRSKRKCSSSLTKEPVLICSKCKHVFPEFLARCPECGSRDWQGLSEVNPYNYLPMEQFLKICGHMLWLFATIGSLFLLWQTNTEDRVMNEIFVLSAILLAFMGILISVAYFGMSELTRRVERIQKRLRAFHENYRNRQKSTRYRR